MSDRLTRKQVADASAIVADALATPPAPTEPLKAQDLAIALNAAQIEASDIKLGTDLTKLAERIIAALPR